MGTMRRMLEKFAADDAGVTAIEASLGVAILSIATVAVVESVGEDSVFDYAAAAARWVMALF